MVTMCSTSRAFVCRILVKKARPVPRIAIIINAMGKSKICSVGIRSYRISNGMMTNILSINWRRLNPVFEKMKISRGKYTFWISDEFRWILVVPAENVFANNDQERIPNRIVSGLYGS